jgi:hypothetical protein
MTEHFIRTAGTAQTANDGEGFTRDAKSDLFLMAVTDFAEKTYYEARDDRDERFARLVHECVKQDPAWVARFAGWLRDTANIRSRSAALAAEYHRGLFLAGYPKDAPATVDVVVAACSRADEPAEILAYWMSRYGRPIPIALRRGIGEAARRKYNERSALRYDSSNAAVRPGDVLELCRPQPKDDDQSELFKFLITNRHRGRQEALSQIKPGSLPVIEAASALEAIPEKDRRAELRSRGVQALADAGFSWERLSGWLPGGMDAEAWESVIPTMGYMALLRNLRNFDKADISPATRQKVIDKLVDPAEVAKSRQFPYRFFSAFKQLDSMHWYNALEVALGNISGFDGRTLVLVDVSGSMNVPLSDRSTVMRWEVGAVFGAALAKRAALADLVLFASDSRSVPYTPSASVLNVVQSVTRMVGTIGYGTQMWEAADKFYNGHDRVVIFTDMQTSGRITGKVEKCPFIHGFNLAGYAVTAVDAAANGRFEYGGFNDAMFSLMPILENFGSADWPF